jgi:membrane-associated protein
MDLFHQFIDIVLHLDKHLSSIIGQYGGWTYLILFLIIFCETGLVVTPFLPGDSLLFTAGTICALGALHLAPLMGLLMFAAIAGDNLNYWIGYNVGPHIFSKEKVRFLNKEYLNRTHRFYEKYGVKTIILARFMPIIRTFAPFVAGIGRMTYIRFFSFDVLGGVLWISLFILGGYYFGNIPVVKRNFSLVILAIIVVSLLPGIIEVIRNRRAAVKAE